MAANPYGIYVLAVLYFFRKFNVRTKYSRLLGVKEIQ
jgi:hypothetical protein